MDGEKKMITNGKPKHDPNVVASFSDLAHDVLELAELQGELLKLDAIASWKTTRTGVTLLVVGACLLLGCVPILWLTIAEALVEFAEWPRTLSLAVALVIGLVVAGGVAAAAWLKLKSMFASFERSREEFARNLDWVKTSLKRQPARRQSERRSEIPMAS
jgi:hypothetical protein